MAFIDEIKAKAKANKKVIVLPESEDERTYRAAAAVLAEDIANIVIIGNVDDVNGKAAQYGVDISKATVIDPATSDKLPDEGRGRSCIRRMPQHGQHPSSLPADPEDRSGNQACIRILPYECAGLRVR